MQSMLARSSRNVFPKHVSVCCSRARHYTFRPNPNLEELKATARTDSLPLAVEQTKAFTNADSSTPTNGHVNYLTPIPKSAAECSNIDELKAFVKADLLSRPLIEHVDYLTRTPTNLLSNTIGSLIPSDSSSTSLQRYLPEGYHLVYFPTAIPTSDLLPDGTDSLHYPGPPFERRLWAGGSLTIDEGARIELALIGEPAICQESIVDVDVKGTWGNEKVVVEIERKYGLSKHQSQYILNKKDCKTETDELKVWPVVERRKLVFLREKSVESEGSRQNNPKVPPEAGRISSEGKDGVDWSVTIAPTSALLFRFSALTFNAHRIHLDPRYCQDVEGYRNLLVHGPLTVVLMLSALQSGFKQKKRQIQKFDYRNLAPLYVNEPMRICVKKIVTTKSKPEEHSMGRYRVWIEGKDGQLAARGTAEVGDAND